MKASEKFKQFAGQRVKIAEGHVTVYVLKENDEDVSWIVESYHPMEELEEGQQLVALCKSGEDTTGFIAVNDETDTCWVYADGNDEPLDTSATELTLEAADH